MVTFLENKILHPLFTKEIFPKVQKIITEQELRTEVKNQSLEDKSCNTDNMH